MNSKMMVAGLAIGSLLVGAGSHATQTVLAESGAGPSTWASEMSGWHEDGHASMASMMSMMHRHHGMGDGPGGMMGDGPGGMMGDGPGGMMGDGPGGMMGDGPGGASAVPEPTPVPPDTDPAAQVPPPDAPLGPGHEQHHGSESPAASPTPS